MLNKFKLDLYTQRIFEQTALLKLLISVKQKQRNTNEMNIN